MRKFLKHIPGTAGLVFIILVSLVSIFAYILAPDGSPAANTIHLSLTLRKPGTEVSFIHIKNDQPESTGWMKHLISGKIPGYKEVPVSGDITLGGIDSLEYFEYALPEDSFILSHRIYKNELNTNAEGKYIFKKTFWLGTDRYGRDILSRMLIGARISLAVGFIAVGISLLIGLVLGLLAGYYRGWVDAVVSWLINVIWSLPTLLIVIAITLALGKGFWQIFLAVGLTMWVEVARLVRGQVLSLREKEFVEAARAIGASNTRIIFKHILPNIVSPLIVICSANFASAILLEAGLSFLGIGIQPPDPSWGQMLREHYGYIVLDAAYLAIIPGLAIMLLVIAFNMVGNGLRDALDVRE